MYSKPAASDHRDPPTVILRGTIPFLSNRRVISRLPVVQTSGLDIVTGTGEVESLCLIAHCILTLHFCQVTAVEILPWCRRQAVLDGGHMNDLGC